MTQDAKIREITFFNQLALSVKTKKGYKTALNSTFLKNYIQKELGLDSIFEIDNIWLLWNIYTKINIHPINVSCHRSYSAAIMKYIRFLNDGKKIGRRVDYQRRKEYKNNNNHI